MAMNWERFVSGGPSHSPKDITVGRHLAILSRIAHRCPEALSSRRSLLRHEHHAAVDAL